jgi:hypothetical protein
MPTISIFYGLIIQMFWEEHDPPHFHVRYAEYEALIGINDFSLIQGKLPAKALALSIEWAVLHQQELLENWELGKNNLSFKKIDPLL